MVKTDTWTIQPAELRHFRNQKTVPVEFSLEIKGRCGAGNVLYRCIPDAVSKHLKATEIGAEIQNTSRFHTP